MEQRELQEEEVSSELDMEARSYALGRHELSAILPGPDALVGESFESIRRSQKLLMLEMDGSLLEKESQRRRRAKYKKELLCARSSRATTQALINGDAGDDVELEAPEDDTEDWRQPPQANSK